MTTPENGGAGQAPPAGNPQDGQAPTATGTTSPQQGQAGGQAPQAGQQQGEPNGQPDLSAITDPNLRAWVEAQAQQAAEARREAARYRTERNTLAGQVNEFQRANETAEQAAQREAQEVAQRMEALAQENRDLKVGLALDGAAAEAKPINPETFKALLKARVTIAEDGSVTDLPAVVAALRQTDPYLFRRTDAGAGQGAGDGAGAQSPNAGSGINDFIRGRTTASR